MTPAVQALVDAAQELSDHAPKYAPPGKEHEDVMSLREFAAAVIAEAAHTETVEIPQGETCEGCSFGPPNTVLCLAPRMVNPLRLEFDDGFRRIRVQECRSRYGVKEGT